VPYCCSAVEPRTCTQLAGRAVLRRSVTSHFLAHSAITARGIAMSQALRAQRVQELLVAMLQVGVHTDMLQFLVCFEAK